MSSPILPKSIDVSKLRYSELKTLPSGSKTIYINYGTGKLRVQTPVMSLPYGVGEGYEESQAAKAGTPLNKAITDKKYDLTLSFKGIDENEKIKIFHDKLKEIEQKVIDDAFTNRSEWFKDDYDGNKMFVAKLFNPIVKTDKDPKTGKVLGKYPATLKVKVPFDGKVPKFLFDSYDMENNEIEFESILTKLKSGKAQLIIELSAIWLAGGKYGCTWKIISGKYQVFQNTKVAFLEDSDTEKAVAEAEAEENDDEEDDDDIVQDNKPVSDDEDDEYKNNVVEVEKPLPAVKKGRATKK